VACALKISDASLMAMHAMGLLALEPRNPLSARSIAPCFRVSEAHLSKVLQRLAKVGLLRSVRGPKGGFSLAVDPRKTTLMEVFAAIEGPVEAGGCPFDVPRCDGTSCVLSNVMVRANQLLLDHLSGTSLREIGKVFLDGRIKLPFKEEV